MAFTTSSIEFAIALLLGLPVVFFASHYVNRAARRNSSRRQRGVKVLAHGANAEKIEVDIVAVHGLGAHPEFTWTTKIDPQQCSDRTNAGRCAHVPCRSNWLVDFLPTDFPEAEIMTFGYNADWFGKGTSATAYESGCFLLRELKEIRGRHKSRPLLFVGHSFGGLVVKEALVQASIEQDYRDIGDATCGIIFLGTPHQGSGVSAIGALVAWLTTALFGSDMTQLVYLQKHGKELANLQARFAKSIVEGIKMFSFYETLPTCFHQISLGLVVNRDSAGLVGDSISVDKDHSGMNKCIDREDPLYKDICRAIQGILDNVRSGKKGQCALTSRTHSDAAYENLRTQ
ncbi:hypothetical protein W97_05021 [Coniosporium apollinis CBS 100218]|uniref:DUF676 domain-containing protein n=1 Tax=Coniosporium apollinis (strain CBS 100218) TaxID=1168221 RepID=R7YV47_CONA1|nr:uncharacterized protein W97_05021 [Coniosporium apollinis CBS 100218]EON65782.1 hypothetical protein W97_05021 [Coniosporium apollinis CBS 100218]